jgi:hypothetical protein
MNRRGWILLVCFLAGCSTHPIVDACDYFRPGKLGKTTVQPYGGVAIPQGAIVPPAPNIAIGPPGLVPGPPIVPPPAALPGNRPPAGVQLQGPTTDFPPPPPLPGGPR